MMNKYLCGPQVSDGGIAEWKPSYSIIALHHKVLAVATMRIEGAWSAYCVPVPGEDHDEEWKLWRSKGCKLLEHRAKGLFPNWADIPYAP